MVKQSILRTTCFVVSVLAFGPAFAQSPNSPNGSVFGPAPAIAQAAPRNSAPATTATVAPRRQPRTADVPATADNASTSPLHETQDDEAMNRIIRGICRGC